MKCCICKKDVDLFVMKEHMEQKHPGLMSEEEDEECDPNYVPEKETDPEESDSDSWEETLKQIKAKKEAKAASKKRPGTPITEAVSSKKSRTQPTSVAKKFASVTPTTKAASSGNKKTKTPASIPKPKGRPSKKAAEISGEAPGKLPPLKPWRRREKRHRPRTRQRDPGTKPTPRRKFACKLCDLSVTHLPRHLREAHDYSHAASLEYVRGFRHILKTKEPKRPYFKCPVLNCSSVVQWLEQHLRQFHKIGMTQTKELAKVKRHADSSTDEEDDPPDVFEVAEDLPVERIKSSSIHERAEAAGQDCQVEARTQEISAETGNQPTEAQLATSEDDTILEVSEETASDKWQDNTHCQAFHDWLTSVEGGKEPEIAQQHVRQVFTIWARISPSQQWEDILDGDKIRDHFLTPNQDTLAPGTLKSYVGSLKQFYNFIRYTERPGHDRISRLLLQTHRSMSGLSTKNLKRVAERRVTESEEIISPDDISKMLASDTCKEYQELFESADRGEPISAGQYCRMRNFLILMTLLTNGQRSGAIRNANMRGFRFAEEQPSGDHVLIVAHHKTARFGAVTLAFSPMLWRYLNIYVKKVRPALPAYEENKDDLEKDEAAIFLVYPLKEGAVPSQMRQSVINNALQSIWVALKQESNANTVSATKLRKSVTTHVRKAAPENREALASQMTHQASTADRYYLLQQRKENAVNMVALITKVMTKVNRQTQGQKEQEQQGTEEEQEEQEEQTLEVGTERSSYSSSQDVTEGAEQQQRKEQDKGPKNATATSGTPPVEAGPSSAAGAELEQEVLEIPASSRRAFAKEDAAILIRICHRMVEQGPVTQTQVGDELSKTQEGRDFIRKYTRIYGKQFAKKAADRVTTARKEYKKKHNL